MGAGKGHQEVVVLNTLVKQVVLVAALFAQHRAELALAVKEMLEVLREPLTVVQVVVAKVLLEQIARVVLVLLEEVAAHQASQEHQ